MEHFLAQMEEDLLRMDNATFQEHVESLIAVKVRREFAALLSVL